MIIHTYSMLVEIQCIRENGTNNRHPVPWIEQSVSEIVQHLTDNVRLEVAFFLRTPER